MPTRSTFGARAGAAAKARAKQKGTEVLRDWLALTWFTDSTPVFGLRRSVWNWVLLAGTAAAGYFVGAKSPLVIPAVLGVGLLVTVGRAARVMPARRRFVDALIEDTRQVAGHPRSTTSAPVLAASRVKVTRWGRKNRPAALAVTISKTAPAAPPLARGLLKKALDQIPNPYSEAGGGWVYSTNPATGQLQAEAAPAGDERLHQHREIAFLRTKFTDWFKITPKQLAADHYDLQVTEWTTREHPTDGPVPVPAAIRFLFGSHNVAAQDVRDGIERGCDSEYLRGLEWIYTWSDGSLEIAGVSSDSVDAKRKRSARWVADLVAGQASRSKDPVSSQVTAWQEDVHGDPWVPIAFTADFGSNAFTTGRDQRAVENLIDEAMNASTAGLVWVYEWTIGATTSVVATAFPTGHTAALRKVELKRLRSVVEQKFGGRRSDVNVEVLTWQPTDDEAPVALPAQVQVQFGALDVSKPDTRDAFEQHYDGLYTACDWNYDWRSAEGLVLLTAVPRLAKAIPFPENGTPLFNEMIDSFRDGKIYIGPQKGGGTFYWDLNKCAHGLIGGRTGAGKALSVDTMMLTPIGWRRLGDLEVGDRVFDEHGQPCTITGVYDQPLSDTCFEVEFSDGTVIVADDAHLWWTEDRAARRSRSANVSGPSASVRQRKSWLTPGVTGRLRVEADAARPDDVISIPEVAELAGVDGTTKRLHDLAKSIGAAKERRTVHRTYRYAQQQVRQRKNVRVYSAPAVCDYLIGRVRSTRARGDLVTHADALLALCAHYRTHEEVTADDFAAGLGIAAKAVRKWLVNASQLPHRLAVREVTLDVPERTVERLGPAVALYPKAALLRLIADYGDQPLLDQRDRMAIGQVRTTNEIRHSLRTDSGHVNHSIPVCKALQYPDALPPVGPYTLGAWLGDGTSRGGSITSMDTELVDRIRTEGYDVRVVAHTAGTVAPLYRVHGLTTTLRTEGLLKTRIDEAAKRIPRRYLEAGEQQRRDLLAGLLDTDGTVAPGGAVEFTNTNEQLANGVLELARGLGYRATLRSKPARLNGVTCSTAYTVAFSTHDKVFGLHRKQLAHDERTRSANTSRHDSRYIIDVRKIEPTPMRCISVDSPTRQFLAGEALVPTHNSVSLDIILFLTLWCRDVAEIIVCDPKRTDFTWTPEFPSVIRFAAGAIEIADAVGYVRAEMDRRQTILNKRGCRNLRYLRKLYAENPELEAEDGPAPKRLILFFDELANFWMKSDNEDIEGQKVTARSQMEELGQLARALEINMIIAAQKPDKDRMSTQLKEMCEFRLCVGPVNEYTSKQILDSNHGTRFPEEGTPKGRAWATTSELGFQVVQVPYLPNATEQCPWDPSLTITGSKDRLRAQLTESGFQQVMVPNSDGGREPRWVLTDAAAPEAAREVSSPALSKAPEPAHAPEPVLPQDAPEPAGVAAAAAGKDDWDDRW
ncbi:LAGLIDADG family homing endonuclease [Prescottella equi]